MIKIDNNTEFELDEIAISHYHHLIIPVTNDGNFHRTRSLIGRIQARRDLDNHVIDRFNFWNYFLDNNFSNLKRVIVSRPDDLHKIIEEIKDLFGESFLSLDNGYCNTQLTEFGNIVKEVFSYENYRNTNLPANHFDSININYCTYCNKNEVQNINVTNDHATDFEVRMRLYQLDHFYPRSRHPYLSLSFFNLIPGCSTCNAQLKGEKKFSFDTHFNPFDKSFDDYFYFTLSTIIPEKKNEIEISLKNKINYPRNTIQDFRILKRYNQGAAIDILFEMITFLRNRSDKIQKSYLNQIRGLFGFLEHSNNEVLRSQGIPLEAKLINKKQLGKLKRDVCLQLEII